MLKKKKRAATEVNSSSMADIAFLLLIFFLVTTTIANDKGLQVQLPPKNETQEEVDVKKRNVFNILINSQDRLLVEEKPGDVSRLKAEVKEFITNEGRDPESSENPQKAVVSIKTDRGTSYDVYVRVMDEVKKAYSEARADYLGVTVEQYMKIADKKSDADKEKYDKAKDKYPYQVSDAEPTTVGGK